MGGDLLTDLTELGEFGLIARVSRGLARRQVAPAAGAIRTAIGDDAALLAPPPGYEVVATADALVETVHFRRDWSSAADIGWKALAANVSDLGAMGAEPLAALVTVALPPHTELKWLDAFYVGLGECAAAYGCPVVGGDTVRAPFHVALSVTALGTVPEGQAVHRRGARVGDCVCVTGVLGDSGGGLALLEKGVVRRPPGHHRAVLGWHRRPQPPVAAGAALARAGVVTAMMDLSDGLASDVQHLCRESRVGIRVQAERLPISDAARRTAGELGVEPTHWALHGGEDYQMLFTVPAARMSEIPALLGPLGVVATRIGTVTARGIEIADVGGAPRPLHPLGFAHFRENAPGSR